MEQKCQYPQGQKHHGDEIAAAVLMAKVATGKITESETTEAGNGKDPAAKALDAEGGKARVAKLALEQRAEIVRKAAARR